SRVLRGTARDRRPPRPIPVQRSRRAMNLSLLLIAVAATVALLVWASVDVGSRLLQAWRTHFTRETGFHLRELFLFVDPARLYALTLSLTVLAAGGVWLATGSIALALVVALLLALSPGLVFRALRTRRIEKIEQQLPDALQMLAG